MAYTIEKNGEDRDIVISGFEKGVSPSPHSGIANIQNGNISTESGEVMASYNRYQQTMPNITATGALAYASSDTVSLTLTGSNGYFKGLWITVSNSSNTGELDNGDYYVLPSTGSGYKLATTYNGTALNTYTSGLTADFVLKDNLAKCIATATESYFNNGVSYRRYYVLDSQGLFWVYDTQNEVTYAPSDKVGWFLPGTGKFTRNATGLAVLDGWLLIFDRIGIAAVCTDQLGTTNIPYIGNIPQNELPNNLRHVAFVGHQGRCYYTNGNYIGEVFPDSTINNGSQNIQSFCSWVQGDFISEGRPSLISGNIPTNGFPILSNTYFRLPVVFFTSPGGTLPNSINADTIYYIVYDADGNNNFKVYAAASGGSAISDINTGATGTQYFNTFYPIGTATGATGTTPTLTMTPQRLILPNFETAQCMAEIGNTVVVGCAGNVLYPWNQVDTTPGSLIFLPESNVQNLITVNQMAYVFAGNKANIYITDGSVASLVLKVPDYCAGVPGSPATYVEPYFSWGGAAYIRGRVYFSLQDETSTKAGNCGGIWSFVPTQNLYIGQDTGIALRLENQNSYGTYNGAASLIIPRQTQTSNPPLFWSAWYSDITSPSYGIDYPNTGTNSSYPTVIETDAIPVGTMLQKRTFKQIEYKLASPLDTGATVAISYRANLTDAWTSCGTAIVEASAISGYFPVNFEKGQWLQLQATLTPITSTASSNSFVRLVEMRLR